MDEEAYKLAEAQAGRQATREAEGIATALKAVIACLEGERTWMEPYEGVLLADGFRYPREDQILKLLRRISIIKSGC